MILTGLAFEIYLLYYLFTDVNTIGVLLTPVDATYKTFTMVYLVSVLIVILVAGIYFARESLKSGNTELQLKGKFLLAAFVFFVLGGALDSSIPLNVITLTMTRLIMVLSSVFFYAGFILPSWMKKSLLKEENEK